MLPLLRHVIFPNPAAPLIMSLLQTAADVTVLVNCESSSSERRINPSWTISHLKTKLFPITGIPEGSQRLTLRSATRPTPVSISAADEEKTTLAGWSIGMYDELHVSSLCDLVERRIAAAAGGNGME